MNRISGFLSSISSLWRHARKTHRKRSGGASRFLPARAAGEAAAEQGPDGEPAIGVANFLAFARQAWRVGAGHFRDFLAHAAKFCRHFRAELKTPAFQVNLRDQRPTEDFVAGSLVVDARSVEQIGEMRQKFCPQEESETAFWAVWTHAVDYVCCALLEWTQQCGIVLRVVFEVGVLDQDIFSTSV